MIQKNAKSCKNTHHIFIHSVFAKVYYLLPLFYVLYRICVLKYLLKRLSILVSFKKITHLLLASVNIYS